MHSELTPGLGQNNRDDFLPQINHPKAVHRRRGRWRVSQRTPEAAMDVDGRGDGFGRGSRRPTVITGLTDGTLWTRPGPNRTRSDTSS